MATINAVRFININYNNNSMKINDETMHFNGDSTLVSLKNGGGKSVLIQMMMAPFVHKKYRDAKDRPFESYFTSQKPSFILIEWKLDSGAGKLLTGLMVRRSQADIDENGEPLEMTGIISYYRDSCICDIHNLPVVEKSKKEMVLKNYGACRQLFDSYKKDNSLTFFYYDMNMQAQSKQYFNKLKEYKIDYKEWEKIIKKVNLKESGLSDLFADCRDEKGLVEKWFLETVEEKLNNDNNRMNEFRNIVDKHVRQYSENESKIKRRDIIKLFKEYVCIDSESKSVLTLAQEFVGKEGEQTFQENKIANYIKILKQLYEETEFEIEKREESISEINAKIARLVYEKYSCEINSLIKERKTQEALYSQTLLEKNDMEDKIADTENRLHTYECAKANEHRQYEQQELDQLSEQKKALDKSEEEKAPRRRELGSLLYAYYDEKNDTIQVKLDENERETAEVLKRIEEEQRNLSGQNAEILKWEAELARLDERIKGYGKRETEFNERHHEGLARNILGRYEEGFFEIFREENDTKLKNTLNAYKNDGKLLEDKRQLEIKFSKDIEYAKLDINNRENEYQNLLKERLQLEEEIAKRKDILTYLGLHEEALYDRETILSTADRKIHEKEEVVKKLSKQESNLEKEYRALTKGEIMELSKDFAEELTHLEIDILFGMEWLKKNGRTDQENIDLVRKNPFLPYALIMSRKNISKLKDSSSKLYTSFPIPIVTREEIENGRQMGDDRVYSFEGIQFYVYFNENFLDEEKLKLLIEKKEAELLAIENQLRQRRNERDSYIDKKNLVSNQRLTKDLYEGIKAGIEEKSGEIKRISDRMVELAADKEKNSAAIKMLETKIKQEEGHIHKLQAKITDIERLSQEYGNYLRCMDEKAACEKQKANAEYKAELAEKQIAYQRDIEKTLEHNKYDLRNALDKVSEKRNKYKVYEENGKKQSGYQEKEKVTGSLNQYVVADDAEPLEERVNNITKYEAEYDAITGKLSMEKKDMEDRIQSQSKRLDKAKRELGKLMKRYGIVEENFIEVIYNEEEYDHRQKMCDQCKEQHRKKEKECNQQNVGIEILKDRIKNKLLDMKRDTGKEEILSGSELVLKNFDSEIHQLEHKDSEEKKEKEGLVRRRSGYGENIAGLAEFSDFVITSKLQQGTEFEKDFKVMSGKELTDFKGILVRDYHKIKDDKAECKEALERKLHSVLQIDEFSDEYFKKPLEAMFRLVDTPAEVIRQIDTTVRSYDELMKKIEIDISVIERERSEIIAQLMDYVKEVHDNLSKIDSNSTIRIHERSVKMLRIELPQWQENEGMYHNRMNDFVDDITKRGAWMYHHNENAYEYFGTKINTKNLYDVVVGISNVQIKLFKVEQYKEYPITWAEVAKNSGGEGFLSSFVILSSLLYYMRKDESDIFADNNEGKVLLMDNPFAATYSEHLLRPLMKVAKKNNAQLICLTGLGGDSIYGRFDNIYVLNLVSAGLKRGVQYLKTDHVRGSEPEVMVVSHVEVGEPEQLTLF